mmetsp:Transcript_72553/g.137155  ORF Transcript_72553/g.137155 Transcript_72553/m.137155 type:complete len:389 (+) Transcript_72553:62-1228(+)
MFLLESKPSVRIGSFHVGDTVFLEGTGRWWVGSTFRAVIADVRPSDDSIKVCYSDGGHKRFARAEFASLVRRPEDKNLLEHRVQQKDSLKSHEIEKQIDVLESSASAKKKASGSVLRESLHRAVGGGVTGAAAMVVQVTTLMWLRTTLYYQYRYGTSTRQALSILYSQGGLGRFYRGFAPALVQAPLCRFGDTAANVGVMSLFHSQDSLRDVPLAVKTFASASIACIWRISVMPIDTVKTMLQVEGREGLHKLRAKYHAHGGTVFYHGSLGLTGASFVGHYCWFLTYNAADARVPKPTELLPLIFRNAACGFAATAVADTCANAIRVLKVCKQTSERRISYAEAAQDILAKEGVLGLWGRGLGTRILANGVQAGLFSATWKYLQQRYL